LNLVAFATVLAAVAVLRATHAAVGTAVFVLCAAVAVPVVALDVLVLRVHRRASTGLDWSKPYDFDLGRGLTKLLGLAFTLALIALAYWVSGEYHGSFYDPLYYALEHDWPVLVPVAIAYVLLVDGFMREPRDAYWQLGRVVLLRPRDARAADVANHFRGWLVKAFFFPLMLVWLTSDVHEVLGFDLAGWRTRGGDYANTFLYFVDLLFSAVGYALSMRVIDTHLRTAEPTMFGWAVALVCYPPFNRWLDYYLAYGGNHYAGWLGPHPVLRDMWGGAVAIFVGIYVLATITFGVRFSNLTHRGILTNGPYRFTKHPAYIAKNLSWWLASIPFVPLHGWPDVLRHCLALGGVNTIYFLRARTEEAHLSRDPAYVAYALWINEHGALAFLGRWFPILKYKPPAEYTAREPLPAGE
jgi:hypothetical protein